jgi:hypothetical protein
LLTSIVGDGKPSSDTLTLPSVFSSPVRPDLVQ